MVVLLVSGAICQQHILQHSYFIYLLSGSVFVFRTALYCKICIIFELFEVAAVEHLLNIFISFNSTALCISESLNSSMEM